MRQWLMPQANSQDRQPIAQSPHQLERTAGLDGRTGARRKNDRGRLHRQDFIDRDRVIAHDDRLLPQPLEVAGQVEDKAIVIVDEQDHSLR